MVVGSGGAGKSTFADALGASTGLPVTHLDAHFWKPGWVETPQEQWRAVQARMVAEDAWILDGNYSGTIDVRFARADTVILLDLNRVRCVWRVTRRTLGSMGEERTAAGCPDRFDIAFIRFIWTYRKRSRWKILAGADERASQVELVRLRTPKQLRRFLSEIDRTGRAVDDR